MSSEAFTFLDLDDSLESPVPRGRPFEATLEASSSFSLESPVPRDRPFETIGQQHDARGDIRKTNIEFYHFVKKHVKSIKMPFKWSQKFDSAVKDCLKSWFKVNSLTQPQKKYAENFANKVPRWYKTTKSDKELFRIHEGMYERYIMHDNNMYVLGLPIVARP